MRNIDWELLLRYVMGECTPAEREQVEHWVAADPEHAGVLAGARQATALGGKTVSVERSRVMLARIRAERPARRIWSPAAVKIAAAVALVAGAGLAGQRAWQSARPSGETPAKYSVISTAAGQRLAIRLPDSTLAMLAPGTTLRTPSTYGRRDRTVELDGEAAFMVVHDETRPFRVRTSDMVAEDLGTEFAVRAYAEDKHTTIAVREGVVSIVGRDAPAGSKAAVLEPGYQGKISTDGTPIIEPADLSAAFAWTDGRLVFRDTPLGVAVRDLSRWYDIEVRLASTTLRSLPVTASFEHQLPREVVSRIAMSLGLTVSQAGRTFTLK